MPNTPLNIFLFNAKKTFNLSLIRQKTFPLSFHFSLITTRDISVLSKEEPTLLIFDLSSKEAKFPFESIANFFETRNATYPAFCLILIPTSGPFNDAEALKNKFPENVKIVKNETLSEDFLIQNIVKFSELSVGNDTKYLNKISQFEKILLNEIAFSDKLNKQKADLLPELKLLLESNKHFSSRNEMYSTLGKIVSKFATVEHFTLYEKKGKSELTIFESTFPNLVGRVIDDNDECPPMFCLTNRLPILVNNFENEIRTQPNPIWPEGEVKTCFSFPLLLHDEIIVVFEFCNVQNSMDKVFTQAIADTMIKQIKDFIQASSRRDPQANIQEIIHVYQLQLEKINTQLKEDLNAYAEKFQGNDSKLNALVSNYVQTSQNLFELFNYALPVNENLETTPKAA